MDNIGLPSKTEVQSLGISRLCHFTPSRNFGHIANAKAILSTSQLQADQQNILNPTDANRFDGYGDHVCCSIQYPNAWYFQQARKPKEVFKDWVVLLISPHFIWTENTKFCSTNAAMNRGEGVRPGKEAFKAMFAQRVVGARMRTFERRVNHPTWLPTDEQAELLIPGPILYRHINGLVVKDKSQAKRIQVIFDSLEPNLDRPPIFVVREFYYPGLLSDMIRNGRVPNEQEFIG